MSAESIKRSLIKIGGLMVMTCATVLSLRAGPMISEFMAANTNVLADEDGAYSDWIELHNPDATAVNLAGWYLTDSASSKTKWQLPAVTLAPGAYLVIFASSKDRTNPSGKLHTNFALGAGGEYLGLIRPDGATAESEFEPAFPAQSDNMSYGRVTGANGAIETGFLRKPTPGAANGGTDALLLIETVDFSPPSGVFQETINVDLYGAAPGQDIRYVTATGADSAAIEVTRESPIYTGTLTFDSTTLVRAAVFSADGNVRGATKTAHFVKAAPELANFKSGLPVLVLDVLGAGELVKDNVDHASWLYGYAPVAEDSGILNRAPTFATPLLATVRGSTSAEFPKKGYNVKMRDAFGNKRTQSLFGLPAYERWALVAPWSYDLTYINNAFVYELSNRIGRWAPRTRLAEVFYNAGGDDLDASDYGGIYVISDRIRVERGRVDINELSAPDVSEPAVTGGYVIKIDPADPDEIAWRTEYGVPASENTSIVLVAPDADDIAPAQLDYIQGYVQRMENALHANRASGWSQRTYLDYIDRPSWIDHHILNVLVNNPDGLYRSAYFTKPRGGKLQAGPVWDFDRALGGYWDERSEVTETWSGVGGKVDLWQSGWWGILAEDPEFMQDWIARWQSLRATHFSTTALTTLADTLAKSVGDESAARDAERWPDNASPYGSHAGQIETLKDWLTRRTAWIDAQFVARPVVTAQGGQLTFTAPEGALLAYTLDGTDPRLLGGGVAPNAQFSSEPLTVPASANVHVRSYNPAIGASVPGSPWSSPISGASASPLLPQARLANFSGRAIAGLDGDSVIVGVGVADTEAKRYLARAVGPGLAAFGVTDTVGAPHVRISNSDGAELQKNVGWKNGPNADQVRSASDAVGAFQLADADSALIADLPAGSHTIEIASTNSQPGVTLGELFELDANGRTANLALRGRVSPGNPLVAGFVLEGAARKRLLVRAVGPTLTELGAPAALADPVLAIHSASGPVAANDRWNADEQGAKVAAAAAWVGAFPLLAESEDAATLVILPAGVYTVEVKGKEDASGAVWLEIFEVP
jgi:hypothetical protein